MDLTSVAFRGETLDRLSAQLHESRVATKRGVENAMPLALAGLAEHARSEQNAQDLLRTFRSGDYPHADSSEVAVAAHDAGNTSQIARAGTGFLNRIFGDKLNWLIDAVAGPSGLSRSSATTVLGLAMPLVLSEVGKEARTRDLDAGGLSRFLSREEQRVSGLLPTTFASAFRGSATAGRARADSVTVHRGLGWAWIALAALAAFLLLFVALRGSHPSVSSPTVTAPQVNAPQVNAPEMHAPAVAPPPVTAPEMHAPATKPAEPPAVEEGARGTSGEGPQRPAIERQTAAVGAVPLYASGDSLASYLASDEPTPRRFLLEDVKFGVGSSQANMAAGLAGVVKALQDNPSAKVRIEGHTDYEGSARDNQKLSEARAEAIKGYLVSEGIDADRIETAGHSEYQPLATNETREGRAENRRAELVVRER